MSHRVLTIAHVRAHRRSRAGTRRTFILANGARVPARLYWLVFWYFDVGPRWKRRRL